MRTKGPVRSQRPVHMGRITAHDLREDKKGPQSLFKSKTGRWVLVNVDSLTQSVEGFEGSQQSALTRIV